MTTPRIPEGPGTDMTFEAAADLSAKQNLFVKISDARTVNIVSAVADIPVGILYNKPAAAGRNCTVRIQGRGKVYAGGAVSAGNPVKANSSGYAVVASPNDYEIQGFAETDAASGQPLAIIFDRNGKHWPGVTANAALATTGLGVVVGSDSLVTACTATTDPVTGVIQAAVASGAAAPIALPGDVCTMRAGLAVVPGTIKVNATGYWVQTATGDQAHGVAFTTAASGATFTGLFTGSVADQTD